MGYITEGRQDWNSRQKPQDRNRNRDHREMQLYYFSYTAQAPFPMEDTVHSGLYSSTSITNQENAPQTHPPAHLMGIVPQMKFSELTLTYVS